MAKIYLETSFFSACVTTRVDDGSVWRRNESRAWWSLQRRQHEVFISAEVVAELARPTYPSREAALAMTAGLTVLPVTDDVIGLAKVLVAEKVMPGPEEAGDAIHAAIATAHHIEFLLTWNQKHLANVNKVKHLQAVCLRAGYIAPQIITPEGLWNEGEL